MGISVNSRSSGASRIRTSESSRLMEVEERLPTKYPTLYLAMVFLPEEDVQWWNGGAVEPGPERSPRAAPGRLVAAVHPLCFFTSSGPGRAQLPGLGNRKMRTRPTRVRDCRASGRHRGG